MELGARTEEDLLLQAAEAYGWTAPRDQPFVYLVARDDAEDDRLVAGLENRGFAVMRLPLLETVAGQDSSRLRAALESLAPGTAVAWTSGRAAAELARVALPDLRAILERTPLFALGESSAATLTAQGFHVAVPPGSAEGGAKALARFLAAKAERGAVRRVLYLAGNRSLPDFSDELTKEGVGLDRMEVYATRFLRPDVRELRLALEERRLACAVFFSPSAAEALQALFDGVSLHQFHRIPVAAKGPTTATAIRALGFRSVDAGLRTVTPRRSHPLAFLALHLMDETLR